MQYMNMYECITKQSNLPLLGNDIILNILSFIGDWRYDSENCEIIPMIYHYDARYPMLYDFLRKKKQNIYTLHFSNRGHGEALRIGYNIPIKESIHLPTADELWNIYRDECYDYHYDRYYYLRFNKDCLRYLQIQLNIYNPDTDNSTYKILSRITKYNGHYDSSDTDCDQDERRSFEMIEYT